MSGLLPSKAALLQAPVGGQASRGSFMSATTAIVKRDNLRPSHSSEGTHRKLITPHSSFGDSWILLAIQAFSYVYRYGVYDPFC